MATLSDIARAAGVSTSVVSRLLNGDASLRTRPDTQQRVLAIAAELGYRPNHAARSLRTSRSSTIGLFMPDVTNPIVAEVLQGVDAGANDRDLQVLLGRVERVEHSGEGLRRLLSEGRVDGLLVQLSDALPVEEFEELARVSGPGTPVVLLHARGSQPGSVVLDDEAGAAVATQHLLDLGHRDIGFVGGPPQSQSAARRLEGHLGALRAAGVPAAPRWRTQEGYLGPQGHRAGRLLLERGDRPSALVVANINAAAGVVSAAHELGVRVPQDLSVVAIHDTWIAEYLFPKLTTVRMPLHEMGREAITMITGVLAGDEREDRVVDSSPPLLVVRGSTAPTGERAAPH